MDTSTLSALVMLNALRARAVDIDHLPCNASDLVRAMGSRVNLPPYLAYAQTTPRFSHLRSTL